jgi:hypothetical protein
MGRIKKLIDRADAHEAVAAVDQDTGIPRQCRGIAGDRDDRRCGASRKRTRLRLGALPGRIEHDGIERLELIWAQGAAKKVAHVAFRRLETRRSLGSSLQGGDRWCIMVRCVHASALRKAQRKWSNPAKQVGHHCGV